MAPRLLFLAPQNVKLCYLMVPLRNTHRRINICHYLYSPQVMLLSGLPILHQAIKAPIIAVCNRHHVLAPQPLSSLQRLAAYLLGILQLVL